MSDDYCIESILIEGLTAGVRVTSPHGSELSIKLGLDQLRAVEETQPPEDQDPAFNELFEEMAIFAEQALQRADACAANKLQRELDLPKPEINGSLEIPQFLRRN